MPRARGLVRGLARSTTGGAPPPIGSGGLSISYGAVSITTAQMPYALAGAALLSGADALSAGGTYQWAISITDGNLTLSGIVGLTFSVGDGTANAAMTFTGTLANTLAAIAGLVVDGVTMDTHQTITVTFSHPATSRSVTQGFSVDVASVVAENTVAPVISGNKPYGSTLTGPNGTWTSDTTITDYLYQWYRDAVAILLNGDSQDYVTIPDDIGHTITRGTRAINTAGQSLEVISNGIVVQSHLDFFWPDLTFETTDQPLTLSGSNKPYIIDPDDDGTRIYTLTFAFESGDFTLSGTTGITFDLGDGTADQTMTIEGTKAAINAALDGSIINNMIDGPGDTTITGSDSDTLDIVTRYYEVEVTLPLADLPRAIPYPSFGHTNNTVMSVASGSTLDAAGEYDAMIFRAPKAMAITHVYMKPNAVSGSPTAVISIEGVDLATGLPDGTVKGATNNGKVTTGTLTTSGAVHALGETVNIAAGEYFAVKFAYNGGTSFALSRISFSRMAQSVLPYPVGNTGTPTKAALGLSSWACGLMSSSTAFIAIDGFTPVSAVAGSGSISTSTYDAYGVRFRLPFKTRISGFIHTMHSSSYGPFTYGLYDDSGTELSSSSTAAIDSDLMGAQASGANMNLPFDNPVELAANTWYMLLLWPTTTTAFNMYTYTAGTTGAKAVMPGGADWHLVTKAVGGAYDKSQVTVQPVINLLLDQLSG